MDSLNEILKSRKNTPLVEANPYQDLFIAAILAVAPASHWHHYIWHGWISHAEWVKLCTDYIASKKTVEKEDRSFEEYVAHWT